MEPILPGAPWLIAHKSMLGVNKPNKVTLNGHDYVMWQNKKGDVVALDNVCPHMQAPLSNGWVCQDRNTITCPFHALEFDLQGKIYQPQKTNVKPITQPLELIVVDDLIWTYAGMQPRLPIPDLHQKIAKEYEFVGIAGETSIQSDFLRNLMISYDYNHQNGTHHELFKIRENKVSSFEPNGYQSKVIQELYRDHSSLIEIIQNPAILTIPKVYKTQLEYAFPSTTVFAMQSVLGKIAQVQILYPETESRTKTFVLGFAKLKYPWLKPLLYKSFLKAIATVVEQDKTATESLYPQQQPKIRLPNEEIMFYAEKLYRDW